MLKMSIPTELIPICLDDGLPMTMNLRADENFVEDAGCSTKISERSICLNADIGQVLRDLL